MKCKFCKKDLGDKQWKYCPHCGEELAKKSIYSYGMQDVTSKMLSGIQRILMRKLFTTLAQAVKQSEGANTGSFRVKVISSKRPIAQATKQATVQTPDMTTASKRPIPKETIEPKADITKLPGKLKINIPLPGIECMDDIDILKFENSCEIRAYTRNKLYFKIIQTPPNLYLNEKNLDNETLLLEFTR
ncbi:MAG: hypothetical protein DRN71_01750 [Candidatus Nanohalarchaeota archaeon]|nr:MAG: hypothetical protein DRN71_01750 [Candidatus Nanohaloarchaeota archaeon]